MQPATLPASLAIADVLTSTAIAHQFVGDLALLAHGAPRPTQRSEVAAALRGPHAERVLTTLRAEFEFTTPEPATTPRQPKPPLQLRHRASGADVTLHTLPDTDYDRRAVQRASLLPVADSTLRVASAEDLLLWELRQLPRSTEPAPLDPALLALLRARAGRWNQCYLLEWSEPLGIAEALDDLLAAVRT